MYHWCGMSNGVMDMEHNLAVFWKVKCGVTIWPSNYIPRCIPNRNENILPHKDLYTSVHSSIIHDSQDLKTTDMFINWWIDKQK